MNEHRRPQSFKTERESTPILLLYRISRGLLKDSKHIEFADIHTESALYWKAFGTANLFICINKVCWFLIFLKETFLVLILIFLDLVIVSDLFSLQKNWHNVEMCIVGLDVILRWNNSWFYLMTKELSFTRYISVV